MILLPNASNIFVVKDTIVLTTLIALKTKYVVGANVLMLLGLAVVQSNHLNMV